MQRVAPSAMQRVARHAACAMQRVPARARVAFARRSAATAATAQRSAPGAAAALFAAGGLVAAGYGSSGSPVKAQAFVGNPAMQLNQEERIRRFEVAQAERVSSAVVFIKPHAVTDKVKQMVAERFASEGISVLEEGPIEAERIDKEKLIDTHYGAIAARAMKQKPSELVVQAKAQDEFQRAFGLSWQEALAQGLVFNLADGAARLDISMDELGRKYDQLTKGEDMLKFGGGFYCGKVDGIYVINGFYAKMRSQFTAPGTQIYFYNVEWDPKRLSWADFRNKVLGGTDPKTAEETSLRHAIFKNWEDFGLASEPNTGSNGMHASASPFEALAERVNWLGVPLEQDFYGRAMLSLCFPWSTIRTWFEDPTVEFEGKKQSLFDLLEDLDGRDCLRKSMRINADAFKHEWHDACSFLETGDSHPW